MLVGSASGLFKSSRSLLLVKGYMCVLYRAAMKSKRLASTRDKQEDAPRPAQEAKEAKGQDFSEDGGRSLASRTVRPLLLNVLLDATNNNNTMHRFSVSRRSWFNRHLLRRDSMHRIDVREQHHPSLDIALTSSWTLLRPLGIFYFYFRTARLDLGCMHDKVPNAVTEAKPRKHSQAPAVHMAKT
jgi:hypothetical protein